MILSAQSILYDGRVLEQIPPGRFPLLPQGNDWIILFDTSFRPKARDRSIRKGYNDFGYNAEQFKEIDSFLKKNNNVRTVAGVLEELRTGIKGLKGILEGKCLGPLNRVICYESRVANHLSRCLTGEGLGERDKEDFQGICMDLEPTALSYARGYGVKIKPPFTDIKLMAAAGAYSLLFNNQSKKVTIASADVPLLKTWARMTRDSGLPFGKTYVSDSLVGLTVPTQDYRTANHQS